MEHFTVKHTDKPILGLPEDLLKALNLQEGDRVVVAVEYVARQPDPAAVDAFLALSGVFAGDAAFDEAMRYLDRQP
ncbi:MAG: AbrB/MazE/SpoVT family DNA-binding domain-containing protein [Anaerolineae bacterium]|nr:AbrB/MazE/SpoVT family DNA-binding domain-containing protein [Anaerolineae bacterium]